MSANCYPICRKIAGSGRPGATSPLSLTERPPGADPADVSIALRMPLMVEGVERELGYCSRRATDHSRYWSFDSWLEFAVVDRGQVPCSGQCCRG